MPIFLDEIPDRVPAIKRPVTRRWLILLLLLVLIGCVISFAFWRPEKEGVIFWLAAPGIPLCIWGVLFGMRRIAYKADQVWAESWNANPHALWRDEVLRGQRAAWVMASGVITQAGSNTDKLWAALKALSPIVKVQNIRNSTELIRHSKLTGFEDEDNLTEFNAAIKSLITLLNPVLKKIPGNIPCGLIVDLDTPLIANAQQSAIDIITAETGRSFSLFNVNGFTALDDWLDNDWYQPSLLLSLSAVIRDAPQIDDGEAITLTLMLNREHPEFPDAVQLHRPEKYKNDVLAKTLSRGLLWSKLSAEEIKGSWVAGENISQGGAWISACEQNALPINMTQDHINIDHYIGQVGLSSPWLAVALAALSARSGMPQIIAVEAVINECWIAAVTSGDNTGIKQDAS